MKKLYAEKKRLIAELNTVGRLLDSKIVDRFGFHYSQTDDDTMIDTLDYGTNSITYADFIERMTEFKQMQDTNEWQPNA